jgi:hypothetical protein
VCGARPTYPACLRTLYLPSGNSLQGEAKMFETLVVALLILSVQGLLTTYLGS